MSKIGHVDKEGKVLTMHRTTQSQIFFFLLWKSPQPLHKKGWLAWKNQAQSQQKSSCCPWIPQMSLRGTIYMLPESDSWLKECLLASTLSQTSISLFSFFHSAYLDSETTSPVRSSQLRSFIRTSLSRIEISQQYSIVKVGNCEEQRSFVPLLYYWDETFFLIVEHLCFFAKEADSGPQYIQYVPQRLEESFHWLFLLYRKMPIESKLKVDRILILSRFPSLKSRSSVQRIWNKEASKQEWCSRGGARGSKH